MQSEPFTSTPAFTSIRSLLGVAMLVLLIVADARPGGASEDPASIRKALSNVQFDATQAVSVSNLRLAAGAAELVIAQGTVVPAVDASGRVAEFVFIGEARLILEPPDDIESAQLELFSGERSLDENLQAAVFVVALDAAVERLLRNDPGSPVDTAQVQRAEALYNEWRQRPERRLLRIEQTLLRDALGDPAYEGYFAGWVQGQELGKFLYVFEPAEVEPVTLGKFTPAEATERVARQLRSQLHRQQRQGRLIGLDVEDLGTWDTWVSARGSTQSGRSFEPEHYQIDVKFNGDELLEGRVELKLKATRNSRMLRLHLHSDLEITSARDGSGRPLFVDSDRGEALVVLAETVPAGEVITVEVEWNGVGISHDEKYFTLRATEAWYPHAGSVDLATYDVTFRWPEDLQLVTGGTLIDSGKTDGMLYSQNAWKHPTFAVSFEVGKLQTLTAKAGDVDINLAVDPSANFALTKIDRREVLDSLVDAFTFLQDSFGPYPLERLVVVTTPRGFSQSFHGFITLSSGNLLGNDTVLSRTLGMQDRRTLIAHELAHQWWGHQVLWEGYRDQWLSEAMANYAAVLYGRSRLSGDDVDEVGIGPTSDWKTALLAKTRDGRPVESIGPLVLGARLSSSRADAYQAVVYEKGAVVIDMLARRFGQEVFLEMLRRLINAAAYRSVSTAAFFEAISQLSSTDLEGFVDAFVYKTGLPEISYRYGFEPLETGSWRVSGTITRHVPFHYRYSVKRLADGDLDVVRERIDPAQRADLGLVIPFRVAAYDPDIKLPKASKKRRRGDPSLEEIGNVSVNGRLLLEGLETPFSVEIEQEPKDFWLDSGEVLARLFNESRFPKRMLYYRALDSAAAGDMQITEELLTQALAAVEETGSDLDLRIMLLRTRLMLDLSRLPEAETALAAAEVLMDADLSLRWSTTVQVLRARLALRSGDAEETYRLLHKSMRKSRGSARVEANLLFAIAVLKTGKSNDIEDILSHAEEKGADVTLLRDALEGF